MKFIFILLFISATAFAQTEQPQPPDQSDDKPTVIRGYLENYFYPGLNDKIAQIWDFVQQSTGSITLKSKVEKPIIYFSPFTFAQEDASWVEWQKSWIKDHPEIWDDWKKQSNGRPPDEEGNPFPKTFAAFEYYGSPRIQVNPFVSFIPYYQYDLYGNRKDIAGFGYYAVGHELHHYTLNLMGVPMRLHHCIFIKTKKNEDKSYMEKLADFLMVNNISSNLVKYRGADSESMMDPCRYLTTDDLKEVDSWLEKL